jgi:hypothetical protein
MVARALTDDFPDDRDPVVAGLTRIVLSGALAPPHVTSLWMMRADGTHVRRLTAGGMRRRRSDVVAGRQDDRLRSPRDRRAGVARRAARPQHPRDRDAAAAARELLRRPLVVGRALAGPGAGHHAGARPSRRLRDARGRHECPRRRGLVARQRRARVCARAQQRRQRAVDRRPRDRAFEDDRGRRVRRRARVVAGRSRLAFARGGDLTPSPTTAATCAALTQRSGPMDPTGGNAHPERARYEGQCPFARNAVPERVCWLTGTWYVPGARYGRRSLFARPAARRRRLRTLAHGDRLDARRTARRPASPSSSLSTSSGWRARTSSPSRTST